MGIRRYINTYNIQKYLSTILTATACIGVVATGIFSARAMKKYMEATEEPSDHIKEAVKAAALPTVIGAGTIASFMFARKADKAVIAGLSASVASLSARLKETNDGIREMYADDKEAFNQKVRKRALDYDNDCIVIDPDGDLYYDEISGNVFCVRAKCIHDAKYKVNRNFQLRCGYASLYEFYRFMGLTKKQIEENGLEWSKYIGWHAEDMQNDGVYWIDSFEDVMKTGYNVISFATPLVPICCDPPEFVKDLCHCNDEDLKERWWLDPAEDVEREISMQICDDMEE